MAITLLPCELDQNLTLWRYMKLSTFFLLAKGRAFFPSIETLRRGDPLEGDLHPDPEWLISKLRLESGASFGQLQTWLRDRATKEELENQTLNQKDASYNTQSLADLYVRELAKRRAVWCWFASNCESAGMWSAYGHNGIAVHTTLSALQTALPNDRDFQIGQIRYAGREPNAPDRLDPESTDSDQRIHRPHLIKGSEYKSENEIRVVTPCPGSEKGALVRQIAVNTLIQEVVISPLVPYEEAKAVEAQMSNHPWELKPIIRRSSLLGERNSSRDETGAALAKLGDDKLQEADLPALINTL